MNGFLKWFFAFISEMLGGFALIFKGLWHGIKQIFNVKEYVNIFKSYSTEFGALSWVLAVIAIIIVAAIFALLIFMIVLAVRKYLRFRHSIVSNEDLIEEIADLQRKVVKMAKEKDDIMAMKVAQMGLPNKAGQALSLGEDGITAADERTELPLNAEAVTSDGVIQTADRRFSKLMEVDAFYADYTPPAYDNEITLSGICEAYRNFASLLVRKIPAKGHDYRFGTALVARPHRAFRLL